MSNQALEGLRSIPYFAGISDNALENLAACAVKKHYPKNSVIINEGDDGGSLFIILSGKVQAYLSSESSGRTVTLSTQENGSFFGELSLLDGSPRSASVVTLEPTVCCLIPRNAFQSWLERHPDASVYIIRSLTQRIRILTENVRGLALSDVYGRLAKTMNEMAVDKDGIHIIEHKPSHQELANKVGCSREMVSRIMKDLARGDYISVEGKSLIIKRKLPASW